MVSCLLVAANMLGKLLFQYARIAAKMATSTMENIINIAKITADTTFLKYLGVSKIAADKKYAVAIPHKAIATPPKLPSGRISWAQRRNPAARTNAMTNVMALLRMGLSVISMIFFEIFRVINISLKNFQCSQYSQFPDCGIG